MNIGFSELPEPRVRGRRRLAITVALVIAAACCSYTIADKLGWISWVSTDTRANPLARAYNTLAEAPDDLAAAQAACILATEAEKLIMALQKGQERAGKAGDDCVLYLANIAKNAAAAAPKENGK